MNNNPRPGSAGVHGGMEVFSGSGSLSVSGSAFHGFAILGFTLIYEILLGFRFVRRARRLALPVRRNFPRVFKEALLIFFAHFFMPGNNYGGAMLQKICLLSGLLVIIGCLYAETRYEP
jgi:hypothetical protein